MIRRLNQCSLAGARREIAEADRFDLGILGLGVGLEEDENDLRWIAVGGSLAPENQRADAVALLGLKSFHQPGDGGAIGAAGVVLVAHGHALFEFFGDLGVFHGLGHVGGHGLGGVRVVEGA